jgi:hypothetical protein
MFEIKTEAAVKTEIDLFEVAESAAEVREAAYVQSGNDWYTAWLAGLLLGESCAEAGVQKRLAAYCAGSSDGRRRAFSAAVEHMFPEACRVPLVLYRLLPLAVGIATALAFGNAARATACRKGQVSILPSIADCHHCHGRLLDVGEQCPHCGNPLWKSDWMLAD